MTHALAVVLLLAGVGAVVLARIRDGEFLTPGSAAAAAWSISFGLYLLRMLPYGPMPPVAGVVLALGAGCLLAGIRVGRWCCRTLPPPSRAAAIHDAWLWAYGAAGLAGLAWYVWEVYGVFGSAGLWQHGFQIRQALTTRTIPSRFLFLEYFCVVTPLVAAAAALAGRRLGPRLWFLVAACVVGTWVTTGRTQFFMIVLGVGFMYAYRHGPALGWIRLGGFLLLASGLLVTCFLVLGAWTGKSAQALKLTLTPPLASSAATGVVPGVAGTVLREGSTVYWYATASFAAFAVWYPTEHVRTHGLHSAYPFMRALQRAGIYSGRLPPHIPHFVPIISRASAPTVGWNQYTMLYYPIVDFGLAGMVVYCFAVGMFSGAIYQVMRKARHSPLLLVLAGQVTTALVLSIFVNKFNNTGWWYLLVWSVAPFVIPEWLSRTGRRPA